MSGTKFHFCIESTPFTHLILQLAITLFLILFAKDCVAQLPGGTWQYHWGDEFSGTSLDQSKWSYNYPWGATHNHLAVMSPNNVLFGDGTLTLRAIRNNAGTNFSSGAISTGYNRFTFNGGYVEARIFLPDTPGSWPAFWGLFDGWPPEGDIMEYPIRTLNGGGYPQDQYHTAWHYSTGNGHASGAGGVNPGGIGDLGGAWHNFGMHWIEDDWIGFYFDGQLVSQFGDDNAIAQMQHMYLILNYAVGGWPGTPSTSEWPVGHFDDFKVDWIRIWKQAEPTITHWASASGSSVALWDSPGNWSNGLPDLGGTTAVFNSSSGDQQNVIWSGRRTLSTLSLDGDTRYLVGSNNERLVLGLGNNGLLRPLIRVLSSSTREHEILADLEFVGGLELRNDSTTSILLAGDVQGNQGVKVDGPGAVVFSGNNEYTGNTVIDSGAQGPGIARAAGDQPFGLGGEVIIGEQGNSTTARLELVDGAQFNNTINLNGRHNFSSGIVNLGDNNQLHGTVHANFGGSQYQIESIAGDLILTGNSSDTGVSLSSRASGERTFRLIGTGNGVVEGVIEDGIGTVSLEKSGSGTWTLGSINSYSGTTTVSEGELLVKGSHIGGGTYLVFAGARLSGNGVISPNSGDIIIAGQLVPGANDIGGLILGAGTSLLPTSILEIEIGGNSSSEFDQVLVLGELAIQDANLQVNFVNDFTPQPGETYLITRADVLSGEFANLSEGDVVASVDNVNLVISYRGGDGNDVELTATNLILRGDVNQDGIVSLLDVAPFVQLITSGEFQAEADINQDGAVNLLDVQGFIALLSS